MGHKVPIEFGSMDIFKTRKEKAIFCREVVLAAWAVPKGTRITEDFAHRFFMDLLKPFVISCSFTFLMIISKTGGVRSIRRATARRLRWVLWAEFTTHRLVINSLMELGASYSDSSVFG